MNTINSVALFCTCEECKKDYGRLVKIVEFSKLMMKYKIEQEEKLKTKTAQELYDEEKSNGKDKEHKDLMFKQAGFEDNETDKELFNNLYYQSVTLFSEGFVLNVELMQKDLETIRQERLN